MNKRQEEPIISANAGMAYASCALGIKKMTEAKLEDIIVSDPKGDWAIPNSNREKGIADVHRAVQKNR